MAEEIDYEEIVPLKEDEFSFGQWLDEKMKDKKVSVAQLAEASRITPMGIYNILNGVTVSPRDETRKALAEGLKVSIPKDVETSSEAQSEIIPGYEWADFTPSDENTIPNQPGIYVFYDVTGRAVYVGRSNKNVRERIKDHSTRFWFKSPLVESGGYIHVPDREMCNKLELILIKFLGRHALLNERGKRRDEDD